MIVIYIPGAAEPTFYYAGKSNLFDFVFSAGIACAMDGFVVNTNNGWMQTVESFLKENEPDFICPEWKE